MEKKELKERFFDRFFYAEDGSCDWDRWRKQDPNVVLEFILEELSKAREEGVFTEEELRYLLEIIQLDYSLATMYQQREKSDIGGKLLRKLSKLTTK